MHTTKGPEPKLRSFQRLFADSADLDLDVDASGQVETLESVDCLCRVVDDVDQTLVHSHTEVLTPVLVLVRATNDRVAVLLGWQRHWPADARTGANDRLDDLLRRLVDDLVIVSLEADPDLLTCCSC